MKIGLKFQSLCKISNILTSDPPVLLGQFQHWSVVVTHAGGHRPGVSQLHHHHHVFDAAAACCTLSSVRPLPVAAVAAPRKKARTTFSRSQLAQLEDSFRRQKYLAAAERAAVAHRLNITDAQVKMWFQNRRTKWRYATRTPQNVFRLNRDASFWPTVLSVEPMVQCVVCRLSVCRLSVVCRL